MTMCMMLLSVNMKLTGCLGWDDNIKVKVKVSRSRGIALLFLNLGDGWSTPHPDHPARNNMLYRLRHPDPRAVLDLISQEWTR